jgi:NTE family protein
MLIVGTPDSTPTIGSYVFRRADFEDLSKGQSVRLAEISMVNPQRLPQRVGLALSGGGSRAIAFHLGCLRALHDRGVLQQVQVVSSVSGGAVIAAMYAYSNGSFEEFDKRVLRLLRRGLVGSILHEAMFSPLIFGLIVSNVVAGSSSLVAGTLRGVFSLLSKVANNKRLSGFAEKVHSPFLRWVTITSAFENALVRRLYGSRKLGDERRDNLQVVFNACELRTGSAFRFGNNKSGSWRFGSLAENDVPLALAVAASAAYPVILPAIDRSFEFMNRQGDKSQKRVVLTDGGVFENLGVSCLEPGRSAEFSQQTFDLDYIVCCDAGQGLFSDNVYPFYWPSRMKRSFESVYSKANDAVRARLFSHLQARTLKGFCLPYLGQLDNSLPCPPPDLVKREQVWNYPTDFSAMNESDIELISKRGEQLTRQLISRYCDAL